MLEQSRSNGAERSIRAATAARGEASLADGVYEISYSGSNPCKGMLDVCDVVFSLYTSSYVMGVRV